MLVLANQTVESEELLDELRRIDADRSATYFVVVPASPIETGTAATHGPLDLSGGDPAGRPAAAGRHPVHAALGEPRRRRRRWVTIDRCGPWPPPWTRSIPDQIVIATLPPEDSVWHRFDVVDRARAEHGVPVTHVVADPGRG